LRENKHKGVNKVELKYLGREVIIKKTYMAVFFPEGRIFCGRVIKYKRFKLIHLPFIIGLLTLPLSYHERNFLK